MFSSKVRILSSLLLVLLLCFSMSFSVFAEGSDETVLDGYHIENVPYNSSFDSVLTASQDDYVLYSSDDNKTYKSSSALSASSVDTESVYHYNSVTGFIPTNIWRGSNSPAVTFPTNSSGYTGVHYEWSSNPDTQTFYHYNSMKPFSKMQGGRKYRITFSVIFSRSAGSFSFYLANQSTPDSVLISLYNLSQTINMSSGNKSVSIDFTLPEGSTNIVPVVKGYLYHSTNASANSTTLTFYVNDFTITDITTEDLDKSLGKLGDRIQGFFDNLIESIKGFFIPQEGFFETVKQNFESLLSEHLGFLYEAPQMVGTIFNVVKDWNPPEQPTITLPAFDFDIGDDHIHLWDEQVYTFDFLSNQPWSTLYAFYKTFIFVLLSVAMINLAIKKYHSIIGGGDSDDN